MRVAGTDPGTSSLDIVILENGSVAAERRFEAAEWQADPARVVRYFEEGQPFDLIVGPSGYGIPLTRADQVSDSDLNLMTLVRTEERGMDQGVVGFRRLLRTLIESRLPMIFLPGVIHLSSVPTYRKMNRIDLGTSDKLCVAALAVSELSTALEFDRCDCCVVELGSAFTSVLVISGGRIVDAYGGTSGPCGWRSGGAWDGEAAYLMSPLAKRDLFDGGIELGSDHSGEEIARTDATPLFFESILKTVAAARATTRFDQIVLSGRLLERRGMSERLCTELMSLGKVSCLKGLTGARLKHAAQGAAIIADGLAGGPFGPLVDHLGLRQASGTCLDWLRYSRATAVRKAFGLQ